MPKRIKTESKNYIKTLTFGPGLRIEYIMRLKSYEENLSYRKKNGLDVYDDNDVLVGKCERFNKTWTCYIKINHGKFDKLDELTEMNKLNQHIKEQKLNLPEFNSIVSEGDRTYYTWQCSKKGFFIRNKVHAEIKRVAEEVNKYFSIQNL